MKKKKAPLMTAAEARVLCATRGVLIGKLELKINDLENQIESLEGSRRNLKMMYDTHETEKNLAIDAKNDALIALRASQNQTDRACDVAERFRDELRRYENETATAMWIRSMRKAVAPVVKAASSLMERFRFKRKRK